MSPPGVFHLSSEQYVLQMPSIQKGNGSSVLCIAALPTALIIIGSLALTGILTGVGAICGPIIGITGAMVLVYCTICCSASIKNRVYGCVMTILYVTTLVLSAIILSNYQWQAALSLHEQLAYLNIASVALGALSLAFIGLVRCLRPSSAGKGKIGSHVPVISSDDGKRHRFDYTTRNVHVVDGGARVEEVTDGT